MKTENETFGRPSGDQKVISKLTRKINAMKETIDSLHERIAGLKSSNSNKARQIARLNAEIAKERQSHSEVKT